MNIIKNSKIYFYPSETKHFKNFVSEQKKLLKDPNVSEEIKKEIRNRIKNVKEVSKKEDKEEALKQISLGIFRSVAGLFGPISNGITTILTSAIKRPEPIKDFGKAKKCGRERITNKTKSSNKKRLQRNLNVDSKAVQEGIRATVFSYLNPTSYVVGGLGILAVSLYNHLKV